MYMKRPGEVDVDAFDDPTTNMGPMRSNKPKKVAADMKGAPNLGRKPKAKSTNVKWDPHMKMFVPMIRKV